MASLGVHALRLNSPCCVYSNQTFEKSNPRFRTSLKLSSTNSFFNGAKVCMESKVASFSKSNRLSSKKLSTRASSNDSVDKILSTVVKVGKEGVEAATKFVPESVPRPAAKIGVSVVGVILIFTLIKSIFSTLFSLVILGGLGYAGFLYLTKGGKDSGGDGKGPSSDPLEEAKRIMDKYK